MRSPIITLKDKRADRGQHAGLLLQRYLCENATGDGGDPEEKRSLLHAAISAAANTEVRSLYRGAFERWQKSLPELTAANVFQTQGRLIVGLGSENVLETGIRLHHTYGMPVIPGSALKGLAAHYCHAVFGEAARDDEAPVESQRFRRGWKEENHEYHKLLFGATDDGGCIIFHDAWLIPDSQKSLVLDVMTPHHPKWLDGSVPPTDFDSPTPVPFLSVAGQFHVAVSWHGPVSDEAKKWTELSLSLLRDALKDLGVGGKTTSGYGRPLVLRFSLVFHMNLDIDNRAGVRVHTCWQGADGQRAWIAPRFKVVDIEAAFWPWRDNPDFCLLPRGTLFGRCGRRGWGWKNEPPVTTGGFAADAHVLEGVTEQGE